MADASSRKRRSAVGQNSQAYRRSKLEIGYIVSVFEKQVVANEGYCTRCGKELMSLNDKAEYEFKWTRETVVKHADKKCAPRSANALDENIALNGRPLDTVDGATEQDGDGEEEAEPEGADDDNDDAIMHNDYDSWEKSFLLNENPSQSEGTRQTGLMVRNNLHRRVSPGGKTLAEILHNIISMDRPVHAIEDMLRVARDSSNNKIVPNSFHVLRKALHMRYLSSVYIHICGTCWKFGWKPLEKEQWSNCTSTCTCEICTCPICLEHGKVSKRFKRDLSGRIEPEKVCSLSSAFSLQHTSVQM